MKPLLKKSIAECLGTFVLVFCACGVAALTGGNIVATALAFGLVIVSMAYSVGRVSGCHINPAVSLALFVKGKMNYKELLAYVGSQILGGFIGAVAIFGIAKMGDVELLGNACNAALGNSKYVEDITAGGYIGALLVEVILTCIFVYVILNVTDEKSTAGKKGGLIIGLTLTLVHLVGIPLTGTSVNPARSLATALGALIFEGETLPIAVIWVFIVGPLLGGVAAAYLYDLLHKEQGVEAVESAPAKKVEVKKEEVKVEVKEEVKAPQVKKTPTKKVKK